MAVERSTIVGVFRNRDDAEHAIDELHRLGFHDDEIGFAVRGDDRGVTGTHDIDNVHTGTDKAMDTGTGALAGGLAGAGVGGLIAAAAIAMIPGVGPVAAGGAIAAILSSAAFGAAGGTMVGTLIGFGLPPDEAKFYETEFNEGRILVTVRAGARSTEARDVMMRHGAYDIEHRGGMTGVGTTSTVGSGLHGNWDQMSPRFRDRWQGRYGTSGGRWEDFEPGYRYGWEMSQDPKWQGREWTDAETDLRGDYMNWGQRSGYTFNENDWERHREHARDAWDEGRGTRRAA